MHSGDAEDVQRYSGTPFLPLEDEKGRIKEWQREKKGSVSIRLSTCQ